MCAYEDDDDNDDDDDDYDNVTANNDDDVSLELNICVHVSTYLQVCKDRDHPGSQAGRGRFSGSEIEY